VVTNVPALAIAALRNVMLHFFVALASAGGEQVTTGWRLIMAWAQRHEMADRFESGAVTGGKGRGPRMMMMTKLQVLVISSRRRGRGSEP